MEWKGRPLNNTPCAPRYYLPIVFGSVLAKFTLGAPLTSLLAVATQTDSTPITSQFISDYQEIWVAEGLVDCGASLLPGTCIYDTIYSTETIWKQWYDSNGITDWFTTSTDYVVSAFPAVYQYTPSIIRTKFTPTTDPPTISLLDRRSQIPLLSEFASPTTGSTALTSRPTHLPPKPVIPTHITPTTSQRPLNVWRGVRRSYEFNICLDNRPTHDFVSNSLSEVCNFVANLPDEFTSLVPTTAAYMPSWFGYTTAAIINAVQLAMSLRSSDRRPEFYGRWRPIIVGVGTFFGIIRSTLAVIRLVQHRNSYNTLPFISPLLWVDWLTVADICWGHLPMAALLALIVTVCTYGMCFWLCVGYGHLGYGTKQYEILWSTVFQNNFYCPLAAGDSDPRRIHFLRMHIVLFASGSLGFLGFLRVMPTLLGLGIRALQKIRMQLANREPWDRELTQDGINRGRGFRQQISKDRRIMERRVIAREAHTAAGVLICAVVLGPLVAGAIMAGILNSHSYLILGQKGCYASFVSSRSAYLNVYVIDWTTKIGAWIGVNV